MDDAHIKAINVLAVRLERENKEEMKTIYQRRKQLNERCVCVCEFIMMSTWGMNRTIKTEQL